jgi:hypothetical protein
MDATNIRTIKRGNSAESNYALRDRPLELRATHVPLLQGVGTDAWEDDGGFVPPIVELDGADKSRQKIGIRPPRKQRAARANVPRESINVVSMSKPVPRGVAIAIYEGKSEQEVEIARLEARIRELMLAVERPNPAPMPGKPVVDLDGLLNMFAARKLKV